MVPCDTGNRRNSQVWPKVIHESQRVKRLASIELEGGLVVFRELRFLIFFARSSC